MKILSGLKNCHAKGLDSVIIDRAKNGDLTRVFIAHENCALNVPDITKPVVALHNHRHHELKFTVLEGVLTNVWLLTNNVGPFVGISYNVYAFKSSILDGKMKAIDLRTPVYGQETEQNYYPNDTFLMYGSDVHTVFTKGRTIWEVKERNVKDVGPFLSLTYVDARDTFKPSAAGLYKPMSNKDIEKAEKLLEPHYG